MSEEQARQHLTEMLASFTPGSVLHLLADVIRDIGPRGDKENDKSVPEESLRDATGALFVLGIGLDAVLPR